MTTKARRGAGDRYGASATRLGQVGGRRRVRGFWQVIGLRGVERDPETGLYIPGTGRELWREEYENLVVNEGLDDSLDVHLVNGTQTPTWFLAPLGTTPTIIATSTYANTMSTANQEVIAYTEAVRQTWTPGVVASQSVDNLASPALITINANSTILGGVALVSLNTKNDNSGGNIMYAAGPFQNADKSLDIDDLLSMRATFTSADDGV